jgi:diaminopimelate decarboxylase
VITSAVRTCLAGLSDEDLPAYVYDLGALRAHASAVRAALPSEVELFYAAKANPAEPVLRALDGIVDGIEVASGGELAHVTAAVPAATIAFGGPAKSDAELAAALKAGVSRIHVESTHELRRLGRLAAEFGQPADVLLRVNLPFQVGPVALAMGGLPSQFGLDPDAVPDCVEIIERHPWLRLHGIHAHLASGLAADSQVVLVERVLDWALRLPVPIAEVNVGGGMAVDYSTPDDLFDWATLGDGLRRVLASAPGLRLRIEPGRALTAYCGWYAATVTEVKRSAGQAFALVQGGTHHLRTPAAKGHDQPFDVLPSDEWGYPWPRPTAADEVVTIAGQLCTPKDVLARNVPVDRLRVGDRVVFGLAGAYAWNISHQEFLMHPRPTFHHV